MREPDVESTLYADASALVKLVVNEPESVVLEAHLGSRPSVLASSKLARVEVLRAVRVANPSQEAQDRAADLLRDVTLLDVSDAILARAATLQPPQLRSLDSIHLASALELGVRELLVYDQRLAEAARSAGLQVVSPGA